MQFMLAGTVSFARGLNDTPKIAALLLPVAALDVKGSICAVAIAMLIGAMLGASRVARTMSYGIATLHLPSALSASLVTGLLVGTASVSGLPVSTTHVSVGALVGGGSAAGGVNRSTLKAIVAAWLITLPTAAIFGASVYLLVH
jgi:PiT family inorganic phosphate transporter